MCNIYSMYINADFMITVFQTFNSNSILEWSYNSFSLGLQLLIFIVTSKVTSYNFQKVTN